MARNPQILKLLTIIICVGLFIILLVNISKSNRSYRHIYSEIQQELEIKKRQEFHQQHVEKVKKLLPNRTDLKLDHSAGEPLIFELIVEMEKKIPSLPFEYFYRHSNRSMQKFHNCAQYPAIQVLNFFNTYWQTFYIENSMYHLYGAYYDDRPTSGPVVRILAMSNHPHYKNPEIFCQLWYEDDNRPVVSTIQEFKLIWDENWGVKPDVYYPFLMTCKIPENSNITGDPIPKAVNLVLHPCDSAKNSLRIIYDTPEDSSGEKQDFAVCVKGMDFPYEDLSARLVEWLEVLSLLGVQKVFVHNLQVHANIRKVFNYYQNRGFVDVRDVTLVGGVVGQPRLEHWLIKGFKLNKRLNELITYNDCFYRNMYKYNYIALLDIDEIIMPKRNLKSWQDLVAKSQVFEKLNNCPFAGLCATNVYFPTKLPAQQVPIGDNLNYLFMLNHPYRLQDYTGQHYHVKCLHNTRHALTLHNHYPLSHLNTSCAALDLPTHYAQLQHYRDLEANKEYQNQNYKMIWDDNLQRFREALIERCTKVLIELKFLNS